MPVDSYLKNGTVFIKLPESFKFEDHGAFRKAALGHPIGTRFVIDFSDVDIIDSSSIGMLLVLRTEAGEEKSDISLDKCKPHILKFFKMCQFGDLFKLS